MAVITDNCIMLDDDACIDNRILTQPNAGLNYCSG